MKRFKNILYIIDGTAADTSVAEKVSTLAQLNDAKVTITQSIEHEPFTKLSHLLTDRLKTLDGVSEDEVRSHIDRITAHARWKDVQVSGRLMPGSGFIAIIQEVLRNGHDLVILGDSLTRGVDQLAMRLIRKCPCPVWVIRRTHTGDFRRVLGALDVSATGDEEKALNRKITELTYSLAQREGGEAHYMHAWSLDFELMLRGPRMNVRSEEILELKRRLRQEREDNLSSLFQECGIDPPGSHLHIREGETATVIEALLDRLEVDVLVMGSVARSGIPGFFIGNRAEKILGTINCTVLTVKPDNFVSPVTA